MKYCTYKILPIAIGLVGRGIRGAHGEREELGDWIGEDSSSSYEVFFVF